MNAVQKARALSMKYEPFDALNRFTQLGAEHCALAPWRSFRPANEPFRIGQTIHISSKIS